MAGWLREEQADLAADRILDAAEKAFVEIGVSRASMSDIASIAGCSRGTLYRYFKNRHELHVAYVDRTSRELWARLGERLKGIDDPRERLIEGILAAVEEVRSNPATAAWFASGDAGIGTGMSQRSAVVEALSAAFGAELLGPPEDGRSSRLLAHWIVRVIVSLLSMPGASEEEERELVERFAVPTALTGESR